MAIVHSEASFPRSSIFEDNQYHLYMSMHVTLQIHVNNPWHFCICFYTTSLYHSEILWHFNTSYYCVNRLMTKMCVLM